MIYKKRKKYQFLSLSAVEYFYYTYFIHMKKSSQIYKENKKIYIIKLYFIYIYIKYMLQNNIRDF